jgi:hypothetical protein
MEANIQIEGFFDHSQCIHKFLNRGVFNCDICSDTYVRLDDVPINLIKQIRDQIVNFRKKYILYKHNINTDEFDKIIIIANIYSNIPFVKSVIEAASDICVVVKSSAKFYSTAWQITRVFNTCVLFALYNYVLFYSNECRNCNIMLVHICILIMASILFSFVKIYAKIVSMIEMVIYMPVLLYAEMGNSLSLFSIIIFGYLCVITTLHAAIDIATIKLLND